MDDDITEAVEPRPVLFEPIQRDTRACREAVVRPLHRRHDALVVAGVKHRVERRRKHRHARAKRMPVAVVFDGVHVIGTRRASAQQQHADDPQPHVHRTSYIPFWAT